MEHPSDKTVDVTKIPIMDLLARLKQVINNGKADVLVMGQRIIALETVIDDAIRSLNSDDKHGALACLYAAKVDPDKASFTEALARARAEHPPVPAQPDLPPTCNRCGVDLPPGESRTNAQGELLCSLCYNDV
jgi:hypothetical protein